MILDPAQVQFVFCATKMLSGVWLTNSVHTCEARVMPELTPPTHTQSVETGRNLRNALPREPLPLLALRISPATRHHAHRAGAWSFYWGTRDTIVVS